MKCGLMKDWERDTPFLQKQRILKFTATPQSFEPLTASKCVMAVMCWWLLWASLREQQGGMRACNPCGVEACLQLCDVNVFVRQVFKADDQSCLSAPLRDVGAPEMITSHSRKLNELSEPGRPPSL